MLNWKVLALLSTACLITPYAMRGQWGPAAVFLPFVALCLIAGRASIGRRSVLYLVVSVAFAALGMHMQLEMTLLVMGTVIALAAWDLAYFQATRDPAEDSRGFQFRRRSHLRSLFLALALGALLSFASAALDVDLPFALVIVLALALMASLGRLAEQLGRARG
jgi:hypothetical protein